LDPHTHNKPIVYIKKKKNLSSILLRMILTFFLPAIQNILNEILGVLQFIYTLKTRKNKIK